MQSIDKKICKAAFLCARLSVTLYKLRCVSTKKNLQGSFFMCKTFSNFAPNFNIVTL